MKHFLIRPLHLLLAAVAFLAVACSGLRYTYYEIEHFPVDVQENIRNKNVAIGMTPMQVRYALGAPDAARTFAPREGVVAEEWTYKIPALLKKQFVIFENNEVVKIQTEGVRLPTIRLEKPGWTIQSGLPGLQW